MNTVRCSICRFRFKNLKLVYQHLSKCHTKSKIIRHLLQFDYLNNMHRMLRSRKYSSGKHGVSMKKNKKNNKKKTVTSKLKLGDTKSFILTGNIRIFCDESEVISIGDNSHTVKLTFKNTIKGVKQPVRYQKNNRAQQNKNIKATVNRKLKKRKPIRKRKGNYHINITKLNPLSLDDQNGLFYTCYCRGENPDKFIKSEPRLLTSDTESCSETSKNSCVVQEETKLFCSKCGSGYKTEFELSEHMYIHVPFCRLCNTWYPNEFIFKQHMQLHKIKVYACHMCCAEFPFKESLFKHFDSHVENQVLEDVLDMEQTYNKIENYSFLTNDYHTSMSTIMSYLQDHQTINCNYNCMNTICDVCYKEIPHLEYERHLQAVHQNY